MCVAISLDSHNSFPQLPVLIPIQLARSEKSDVL